MVPSGSKDPLSTLALAEQLPAGAAFTVTFWQMATGDWLSGVNGSVPATTSSPSLMPSPSVSGLFGSVPNVPSSTSVSPSPSESGTSADVPRMPTVNPFQVSLLRLRQDTELKVPRKRMVPWGSPVPSNWYSKFPPPRSTTFLNEVPQPQ